MPAHAAVRAHADEQAIWTSSWVVPTVGCMEPSVRAARQQDVLAIAPIGRLSMRAQYQDLVDPAFRGLVQDEPHKL